MIVEGPTPFSAELLNILVRPLFDLKPSEAIVLPKLFVGADDASGQDELVAREGVDEPPDRGGDLLCHADLVEAIEQDNAAAAPQFTFQQLFNTTAALITGLGSHELQGVLNRSLLDG